MFGFVPVLLPTVRYLDAVLQILEHKVTLRDIKSLLALAFRRGSSGADLLDNVPAHSYRARVFVVLRCIAG